mgnify:FL=1|jgi:outer membrane protein W
MTEKEQENLAKAVAKTVIAAMEKKQKEYDEEFAKQIDIQSGTWEVMPNKATEEVTIDSLELKLAQAVKDEDYSLAIKLQKEISEFLNKD